MHERGKSDNSVVPAKPPNNAGGPVAEVVEGRGLAEGNTASSTRPGRSAGQGVPSGLDRVREVARKDKEARFTALLHHIDLPRLWAAYAAINPKAASGVDQVTWDAYGQNLRANLEDLLGRVHSGAYRASPSRRVYIPKPDGRTRPLGIATLEDKIIQRAVVEVLNAIYEEDFAGFSYGFRPGRGPHDALDALAVGISERKVNWILDADVSDFFSKLDQAWLMRFIEHRIADKRILRLIRKWLAAGVVEDGNWSATLEGSPQGASVTPPTQWITRALVTLRVGVCVVLAGAAAACAGWDAVPDGDLFRADEDVLDQQPQHVLAFGDGGGLGFAAQLAEESFQVVSELEVGVPVGGLGVEGVDLAAEAGFAGAQVRHPCAQLVDGDELLGVGPDHGGDRGGGLGEGQFQLVALPGDRVGGAGPLESLADLGADQGRVGEQAGDVVPDDGVEVVGADRLVAADPPALVAVVVAAQAPVVVDLAAGGPRGGAVVAVAAGRAGGQALQQGRDLGVTGGEPLVVLQALPGAGEGVLGHDRGHGDLGPFPAWPVHCLD